MTLVPPGCQTGYFYVGFGGADFDSTWKDFKDYLRGCDESLHIDHVEVYKDARKGNGWVRVTSLEAFRKVYKLLNGAEIRGRSIMADARNDSMATPVFNVPSLNAQVFEYSYSSYNSAGSQSGSPLSSVTTVDIPEWPAYHQRTISTSSPLSHCLTSQASNYGAVSTPHQYTFTPTCAPVFPVLTGLSFYPNPWMVPAQYSVHDSKPQQLTNNLLFYDQSAIVEQQMYQVSPNSVELQSRRIIITKLPRESTESTLYHFLHGILNSSNYTPLSSHPIRNMDLPKHSDGRLKGHAFILLESSDLAQLLIDRLHGRVYQNCSLRVGLTKEGVTSSPEGNNSNVINENQRRMKSTPQLLKQEMRETEQARVALMPPNRKIACATPVVADGSGPNDRVSRPR